jgi:hypothetical protein
MGYNALTSAHCQGWPKYTASAYTSKGFIASRFRFSTHRCSVFFRGIILLSRHLLSGNRGDRSPCKTDMNWGCGYEFMSYKANRDVDEPATQMGDMNQM